MKKHHIFIAFFIILLTLSCTIYSDGWDMSGDPDPEEVAREQLLQQMEEAADTQQPEPEDSSAEDRPQGITVNQVTAPGEQPKQAREREYAVSATNNGCICSVDNPIMSIELKIDGDQLEYAGNVYNKISENTYKRSYMGYYIVVSGEGDNKTSTQVDEERHDIIILTDDGFISEHYQADESSPCCIHTFTFNK